MPARFQRLDRIRAQADFDRVYDARLFAADDVLIVNGSANGVSRARLGLSVSRKVGGAVVRNRWKRLIREAFRLERKAISAGFDYVVRPQKEARAELLPIRKSLVALARRIAKRAEKHRAHDAAASGLGATRESEGE